MFTCHCQSQQAWCILGRFSRCAESRVWREVLSPTRSLRNCQGHVPHLGNEYSFFYVLNAQDMGAATSTADLLVVAAEAGDVPKIEALITGGAVVNNEGRSPGWGIRLPLWAAVAREHYDAAVVLLSHGADPNGDRVMNAGARCSSAEVLQLLIDAGADVNAESDHLLPVFWADIGYNEAKMQVLLSQPSLDLGRTSNGKTPQQFARSLGGELYASMIDAEVRGRHKPVCVA